jgi:glycosyltransferase involved in cell wall biosynthesis
MSITSLFGKGDVVGKRSQVEDEEQNIIMVPRKLNVVSPFTKPKDKLRVLFCGTYPIGQSNGYSRVVYYIAKYLGLKSDIQLTIYGFQNYKQTMGSQLRNDIPPSVTLHDALATEEPKRNGFGEKEIAGFLRKNPQDIVVIFNDMVITSALTQTIVNELTPQERKQFLLVSYMDQVYPYQKKQYMNILNACFDVVITFTPYWETVVRKLGLKKEIPTYFFPHGFDKHLYYPIPRKLARFFYNVPQDAFVVLNLNRNQPRKRWDHTMMVWAKVVKRYLDTQAAAPDTPLRPLKLMIGTLVDGFWDLNEVYEAELVRHEIPIEKGREFLITMAKPQQMSDRDINVVYNCCDIGLNTCEGEGFGLCQFEHAAVGCPQVCANIGGFKEYLHAGNSILVEPKWNYYIDKQRDGIGGFAEVGDVDDYVEAIWKYYTSPELVKEHGTRARREILQHYQWPTMVDWFHQILLEIGKRTPASL